MKNKAAQELGKLGGNATAKRGKEYYERISKLGKIATYINKRICPECKSKLIEVSQTSGPDDFETTGVRCEKCSFVEDF